MPNSHPFVTVIIPCRNEESYIGACLDSVLVTQYPHDRLEILVVDGMSIDRTCAIIDEYAQKFPRVVRIIQNPKKILAAAWNLGIRHSKGEIIMALNAHGVFASDYIPVCVRYLQESGAAYVGGVIKSRSRGSSNIARAIVQVLSSRFGVGGSHFRIGVKKPVWADTAAFGGYRRDVFQRIGLFNEDLRRSQDFDFHLRMKKAGCKILLVPEMQCDYYIRAQTLGAFVKDYFNNGFWLTFPLKYSRKFFSWRHSMPMFFVIGLVGLFVLGWFATMFWEFLLGVLILYAVLAFVFSLASALSEKDIRFAITMPVVFFLLHISYGLGSLWGLVKTLFPRHEQV